MTRHNAADGCGFFTERVFPHSFQYFFRRFRSNERKQFPFIGYIERIESQYLAGSSYFFGNRDGFLGELDADLRAFR